MAVLGKRKASEPSISEEDANEIFRRHFESRFAPLPDAAKASKKTNDDEDDDSSDCNEDKEENESDSEDDEEWGGVSEQEEKEDDDEDDDDDDDETPVIEVVDHSTAQIPKEPSMSKRELKAFMSSRVPDQTAPSESTTPQTSSKRSTMPEDAPSLLKQDLELRRLISESHLLKSSHLGNASVFSAAALGGATAQPKSFDDGRTRRKATDLRVQALGSNTSIMKQEKMPMHMRKGMNAAAGAREAKRRKEAKENGVILERAAPKKSRRDRPRDRGVDAPGMGKFKGAELKLNKNDIRKLEGSRDTFGRRSRR